MKDIFDFDINHKETQAGRQDIGVPSRWSAFEGKKIRLWSSSEVEAESQVVPLEWNMGIEEPNLTAKVDSTMHGKSKGINLIL